MQIYLISWTTMNTKLWWPKIIFLNTVHQIADKDMHQETAVIKETFFNVLIWYALNIYVRKQQQTVKVTTKMVLGIMEPEDKDYQTYRFLMKYIRELTEEALSVLLRFNTASDIMLCESDGSYSKIWVRFVDTVVFRSQPIAHTCAHVLELSKNYDNFQQFRSEFNAIHQSRVWEWMRIKLTVLCRYFRFHHQRNYYTFL